jgi:hypothetical protein
LHFHFHFPISTRFSSSHRLLLSVFSPGPALAPLWVPTMLFRSSRALVVPGFSILGTYMDYQV